MGGVSSIQFFFFGQKINFAKHLRRMYSLDAPCNIRKQTERNTENQGKDSCKRDIMGNVGFTVKKEDALDRAKWKRGRFRRPHMMGKAREEKGDEKLLPNRL